MFDNTKCKCIKDRKCNASMTSYNWSKKRPFQKQIEKISVDLEESRLWSFEIPTVEEMSRFSPCDHQFPLGTIPNCKLCIPYINIFMFRSSIRPMAFLKIFQMLIISISFVLCKFLILINCIS